MSSFPTPINMCVFIGNLGKDPEMRYTPSGTALTKFSVAVTERVRDAQGEYQDETVWVNLVAWGKTAEMVAQQLYKGASVAVTCKYQTRSYETDGGEKRTAHEFVATSFKRLSKKKDSEDTVVEDEDTEDIPF